MILNSGGLINISRKQNQIELHVIEKEEIEQILFSFDPKKYVSISTPEYKILPRVLPTYFGLM